MDCQGRRIFKIPVFLLIVAGIIARLSQYLFNRSLTEGEAPLALNIISRSYPELLKPLDYNQAAPIGFLFIEKFFVNIFGNNEFALRFFPFATGLLSIFLFCEILRFTVGFRTVVFAIVFFIINDHLIYFSSEVKPYSSDVFFSLLLLMLAIEVTRKDFRADTLIYFSIGGIFFLWFSFPAVFVFAGLYLVLFYLTIKNKRFNSLLVMLVTGFLWLLSLISNYTICLRHYAFSKGLLEFWHANFIPFPPSSWNDFYQIFYLMIRAFKNPGGFSIYDMILAISCFIVGVVFFYRRYRFYFLLFIAPLLMTILGSILKLYPFEGRVILFLAPVLIVFVAMGISLIYELLKYNSRLMAILFSMILYIHPGAIALKHFIRPRAPEELRPVLEYFIKNKREGDKVYIYYGAANAFRYYQTRFPVLNSDVIYGIEARHNWTEYYLDIERLKGSKRVWFLFSHVATHFGVDEERLFLTYLDITGKKIESFTVLGASAHLYDLGD
ncbi:MAG: glycosyltransferase family 39 protein [candidate division WOR-3 bacterium]|nr:glycosyltransferase family 39 protein [candidate division WOR-3 bacterium]